MSWDPVWEEIFSHNEWGKYPAEDLIRFIAVNFYKTPDRKAVKILEVGCGPGANLWYIAREGFGVWGVDGSRTAVGRAKERLDRECPGWKGEVIVGDIGKLPFDDGYFDAVVDNEAVSCNSCEDSKKIYAELARVTKKKGKLFSRTFAAGSWGYATGSKVGDNAWSVSEGPLKGKGYSRFTEEREIPDLIGNFKLLNYELLARTVEDRKHQLKEWIILGEKE